MGKGKQRRKKTESFSLISFELFIPPKSKPKARIIFKASILVPKNQENLLPKLKIYCPQLFMFLPYQMISIIVMPWKSKELLLVYNLKEEYFWCNRLPILLGFPRSRGCFQIYWLTSPEYSYAPILVKNESVGVVTNILKLFARPFCIGSVALLWRKAKRNVNPGLSYFERCSLACVRALISKFAFTFTFCVSSK